MPDQAPLRLPLIVAASNRDETTDRDARLVNGFIEQLSEADVWVYKRPGLSVYSTVTAATGGGLVNWRGNIYSIWGATLYKDGVAVSGTLDTTNGVYTFSFVLGAVPKLFMQNGVKAYTYDTAGGLVQVTDVDYPATTVKGSAYLDGTTYVMTATAAIQGSGINDPTSWAALNSIIAQIEPDGGVAMTKQLVYVIALKGWSTEVFYDVGNPTGSPLGVVQGAKINLGCRHQDTVREIEGALLWVCQTKEGGLGVAIMDSLKARVISTPSVDRLLQQADFTTVYSWTAKIIGHRFYALTIVNKNITMVYDLNSQQWFQWADANGNYLPIIAATYTTDQQNIVQHASNGKVYKLEMTNYTDESDLITVDLYTPNYDAQTRKWKYLHNLDIIADRTTGSRLQIRKSDDDYQTWSNFREVDLGKDYPSLVNCGRFKRRAYHMRHACNTALRIKAVELGLDIGVL